ncbi:MAG: hypothetical protein P8166_18840 [Candidatus Thiodiazotropha sp.]
MPVAAKSITDAEIDKFLVSAPKTAATIQRIKGKIRKDKEMSKLLSDAQVEGGYMRQLVKLVKEWPEYSELEQSAKESGFSSVGEWAFVSDRVLGVIMSANWVVLTGSLKTAKSKSPALTMKTNLFSYLNDESTSSGLRKKFSDQLKEVCERLCYDTSDLPVVGARYEEVQSAINAM